MAVVNSFVEYLLEQLEPIEGLSSARMFGGYVIRKNGLPVVLIFADEAYFKVDASNEADYKSVDSERFSYEKGGKTVYISNWRLPIDILEDVDELHKWFEKSYQVAVGAKRQKKC